MANVTLEEVKNVTSSKLFYNKFLVVKAGAEVFRLFEYNHGKKESKLTGYAEDIVKWINS